MDEKLTNEQLRIIIDPTASGANGTPIRMGINIGDRFVGMGQAAVVDPEVARRLIARGEAEAV